MSLIDPHGRKIRYLRLSVTEKCNFRCRYCRSHDKTSHRDHDQNLTIQETLRLVQAFVDMGVHRVRLTGGEPLLRPGIMNLIGPLGGIPALTDLSLSTNAFLLKDKAKALKKAGVGRVNISLDSLNPETFGHITQGADLQRVIEGIDAALEAGLHPVKLNMVVMGGINDHEIPDMIRFAKVRNVMLRFIETMPIGVDGRAIMGHHLPMDEICTLIQEAFGGTASAMSGVTCSQRQEQRRDNGGRDPKQGGGPARYVRVDGVGMDIGLISAVSRHFCDTCNRVRLTSQGQLVLCLGRTGQVDLRTPLRSGIDHEGLKALLLSAIAQKPLKHDFSGGTKAAPEHDMSSLGG
ncbi:MAG: GTP 3',8-cyclase MoaA [Magnetococcales bacterium]|nr:GTP 3',8-cyclase MoaA [Magnetococcales bacterium]